MRLIPEPAIPQSVHEATSDELERINDETLGMLEEQEFSENKWLSMAYQQWFYHALSEVEQDVIKFHDNSLRWMLWLIGIGLAMAIIGAVLRDKAKPRVQ